MHLRPTSGHFVCTRLEPREKTSGGVILPGTVADETELLQIVKLSGTGRCTEPHLKVGAIVILAPFKGVEVRFDGTKYVVAKCEDVILTVHQYAD